jgi:hypothetical protein
MELNTDIINVLTKDFSIMKTMIEDSNLDNITNSLNCLALSFKQSIRSIEDMKAKLSKDGFDTKFIPYFNSGRFLNEIKQLSEGIIIVSGINIDPEEFAYIKNTAWLRYEKIVVEESHGDMVKNHTDIYVDMFKVANTKDTKFKLAEERISVDPETRYSKFVEMANDMLTMKEIAVAFDVSVPTIYLIRSQFKARLLSDSAVNKQVPAMKFNGKRKV